MLRVFETDAFSVWLRNLKDLQAKARIIKQVQRIQIAERYVGDWKAVSDGIVETRLMFGSGYRLYSSIEDGGILLLLAGGDKSTQVRDIKKARELLAKWKAKRGKGGQ